MTRVQSGNTPQQQKANALRGEYQRLMDDIRNDRTLSPHGKQKELATLYLDYKPRMEKLEADENTQHQTRAKAIRRDLFGLPGFADPNTAISYRDAQDRVAGIEDEATALGLFDRAELSGDTILATAVAAPGLRSGLEPGHQPVRRQRTPPAKRSSTNSSRSKATGKDPPASLRSSAPP